MKRDWKADYIRAFGKNLKKLRSDRGLTQSELSSRSSICLSHISRMERGESAPSVNAIYHLAVGLGLEPKILLIFRFTNNMRK